jgi:hypothetical protein
MIFDFKTRKNELLAALQPRLAEAGFRAKGQAFYKSDGDLTLAIHLNISKHKLSFEFAVDVGVRFEKLEGLRNELNPDLSAKEKAGTYSIGVELGNWSAGQRCEWSVNSDTDIQEVAKAAIHFIEDHAFPYFEEFSSVERVLEAVADPVEPRAWLHVPIESERAKVAIGLAFLADAERFESISQNMLTDLESRKDFGLNSVREFYEGLREGQTREV